MLQYNLAQRNSDMSNSEKRLGAIVLALGVMSVGYFIFNSYTTYLTDLENTKDRLTEAKAFLERDTNLAIRDREQLNSLAKRSLPRDPSAAQTSYKAWLFTLMADAPPTTATSLRSVMSTPRTQPTPRQLTPDGWRRREET